MTIASAKIIWNELQQAPAINNSRQSIDGVNLQQLAQELTSILQFLLSAAQQPEIQLLAKLKQLSTPLPSIIPKLSGEQQVYFAKLYRICDLVLSE